MATTFVSRFGHRTAGELIMAGDANDLAEALDALAAALTGSIAAVDHRVDGEAQKLTQAKTDIAQLLTDVAQLKTDTAAIKQLLGQYYRVNLSSSRVSYATGEQAVITAEIRDLRNQPVTFAADQRPWIDFVTVWGQFAPEPGFDVAGSEGTGADRAFSVRANAAGLARVRLRDEAARDLSSDAHADMAAALTTKLSPVSVAEAILQSATPQEAKSSGAFKAIAKQYEQKASGGVQYYVDSYYAANGAKVAGKTTPPIVSGRWRDYRSTVLAFVRGDGDPTTPDQGRGVSSIQLTFRDWIGPWIVLEYFEESQIVLDADIVREKLRPKVTEDYFDSIERLKDEIAEHVPVGGGILKRTRDYEVVREALDGIAVERPVEHVDKVTRTVKQAVVLQQALETAQATTVVGQGALAIDALTDSTVQSNGDVTAVKGQLAAVQGRVEKVDAQVGEARRSVAVLDSKVTQTSGQVAAIDTNIAEVSQRVNKVQELYPDEVRNQFLELKGTVLDVNAIKQHLNLP